MICDRCFRPDDIGEHGVGLCPYEARPTQCVVRPDSIPGGILIEHGLCNPDGTPRRYDSHSEIRLECAKRNLTPWGHVWEESRTKDARVHADWLQSGEAQRARQQRVEARNEQRLARARQRAEMR